MKEPIFTGSATALVTPYGENGLDFDLLDAVLERQADSGTAALAVSATTGEAPVLSPSERAMLISFCSRRSAGRMKIIAGIGGNDTHAAAQAAREAEIQTFTENLRRVIRYAQQKAGGDIPPS